MTTATDVALRYYRHNFWGIDQFVGDNGGAAAESMNHSTGWYVRHPDYRLGDDYLPILLDGLRQANITALSLASCRNLTGAGITALTEFPEVTFLDLFNTVLTDADLAVLGTCRELEVLDLAGTPITGSVLKILATLPKLRMLRLGFTELEPGALSALAKAPSLATLDLAATPTGDEDITALVGSETLRELGLDETRITERSVTTLRALATRLTRLNLGYCEVTDNCVDELCAFGSLTQLRLRATHIDRQHTEILTAAIPGLAEPNADGTPRILW